MPEGDTIYRSAQTLNAALRGRTITGFTTVLAHLAAIDDDRQVAGRTIEDVTSRGKHILMFFSGDLILRTHMRMNGSWHLYRPGERWQRLRRDMRIVIATEAFEAVGFLIPVAEFRTAAALERDEVIGSLGPDLLDERADLSEAVARLRALGTVALGDALLNQRAVAGVGNVFKSEACFAARLSPFQPVIAIKKERLMQLLQIAQRQLRANVLDSSARALTMWRGGRRTTGRPHPGQALFVYGRSGQPCRRCGTAIEAVKQGAEARLTYYCPDCQRT